MSGPAPWPSTSGPSGSAAPGTAPPSPPATSAPHVTDGASSSSVPSVPDGSTSGSNLTASPPPSSYPVFSPSATEDFNRCPIYARLRKRWAPRSIEWDPALTLGKVVQAGINVYFHKGKPHPDPDSIAEEAVRVALAADFQEGGKYTLEGLVKLCLRGVQAVLAHNLFQNHEILMVDETLGVGRPDVVSRHRGALWIHDFKVSLQVRDDYRVKRLEEYDTKHQFWHYAWEGEQHFGEPVKVVRPILVILSPRATVLWVDIPITPERQAFWLRGAEELWARMARSKDVPLENLPPNTDNCYGKYGKCPFTDACYLFNLDMARASIYYEERAE